jgi:hypothetical protein
VGVFHRLRMTYEGDLVVEKKTIPLTLQFIAYSTFTSQVIHGVVCSEAHERIIKQTHKKGQEHANVVLRAILRSW